jgi:hypothetical protein
MLFVAVVADGLNRAAFERFHTERNFFLGGRLFVNEGIATLVMTGEKRRRRFAAQIAVDALLIYVKLTGNVAFPLVCFVGHGSWQQKGIDWGVKRLSGASL